MRLRWLASLALVCGASGAIGADATRAHTAGPGVVSLAPPLRYDGFGFPRLLRVYLPPRYARDTTQRYPVLYMFDGQNLFDDATSYAGEWGVDESLDALARDAGFEAIVVGIDHGSQLRANELIPYFNLHFLPNKGAAFVDDVVRTIKPFVDANLRTLPAREHTAIAGSSFGGLAADYAIHRYPQVFSRAGVFSPSYWVSDDPFRIAAATPLPRDSRVYLFMGGREGEEAVAQVERMQRILAAQHAAGVMLNVQADAEHNETAWRAAFPRAVRWLFELPSAATDARSID